MKAAVAAAIAEVQDDIERIQLKVREKAEQIARTTHEALRTIDPNLARELTPQFAPPTASKWTGLFSVSLDTDDGIALNKRGSGVRRLILVSFFKAEAVRRLRSGTTRNIIYAIEEPETAQRPNNQRILIESFKALASEPGCEIILTTHSPGFASELPTESIRFVTRNDGLNPRIQAGADVFGNVAETLGVVPRGSSGPPKDDRTDRTDHITETGLPDRVRGTIPSSLDSGAKPPCGKARPASPTFAWSVLFRGGAESECRVDTGFRLILWFGDAT